MKPIGKLLTGIASIATIVVLILGLPTLAYAASGEGSGILTAQGRGTARISGNGDVHINGVGTLWIRDNGGDARIAVTGKGKVYKSPDGWIRYSGYNGHAHVIGSNITVKLIGYNIDLVARGTGSYSLQGRGTYTVNGRHGIWPAQGELD
jgi:hypothetical protein